MSKLKVALPNSLAQLRIPDWLINMEPQDKISWLQFGIMVDFNDIDYYWKRCDEIVYQVSEEMFYYP